MEAMIKMKALLGNDEFSYSGEAGELYEGMSTFMFEIKHLTICAGTFEIYQEEDLYFAEAIIPSSTEAYFTIKFWDYYWNIVEESV